MVADAPRMQRQTPVTWRLRSGAYRVQVDSPLAPGQFKEASDEFIVVATGDENLPAELIALCLT
jgi:hypothetical protein